MRASALSPLTSAVLFHDGLIVPREEKVAQHANEGDGKQMARS